MFNLLVDMSLKWRGKDMKNNSMFPSVLALSRRKVGKQMGTTELQKSQEPKRITCCGVCHSKFRLAKIFIFQGCRVIYWKLIASSFGFIIYKFWSSYRMVVESVSLANLCLCTGVVNKYPPHKDTFSYMFLYFYSDITEK